VVAGRSQGRHDLAPGKGDLWEAMHQKDKGAAGLAVAGLQHVHAQPVHAVDEARSDPVWKRLEGKWREVGDTHFVRSTAAKGARCPNLARDPGPANPAAEQRS
jgi:hypothetical protein